MGECVLNSSDLGQGSVAGFYEHSNELPISINSNFLTTFLGRTVVY